MENNISHIQDIEMNFNEYFLNLKTLNHSNTKLFMFPQISTTIKKHIQNIFKSFGIKIILINKPSIIAHQTWWCDLKPLTDNYKNYYIPLLAIEFSLYPKSFINKINLKKIIICNSLTFCTNKYQQYRAAVPDSEINAMVYCAKETDLMYARTVIHHELFHFFEARNGTLYQKDLTWMKLNPKEFQYGKGGYRNREYKSLEKKYEKYFVNEYSQSGIEEDKAEIFRWMITSDTRKAELMIKKKYPLVKKCNMIKNMLNDYDDEGFQQGKGDFWEKAYMFTKVIANKYYE